MQENLIYDFPEEQQISLFTENVSIWEIILQPNEASFSPSTKVYGRWTSDIFFVYIFITFVLHFLLLCSCCVCDDSRQLWNSDKAYE